MSRKELFTKPLTIGNHEINPRLVLGGMSVGITDGEYAALFASLNTAGTIGGVGAGFRLKKYREMGLDFLEADRQAIIDQLRIANEIRPRGTGMVGVNILAAVTDYKNLVRTAAANGADFIPVGAGLPLDLPALTAGYPDVALIPIVSSLRAFSLICRHWKRYDRLPDAVIFEEPATAGGHLGASKEDIYKAEYRHDFVLPQIRAYLDEHDMSIPLIAAGGIWDRTDIERVMELGADAVQMSTRFVSTVESSAPREFQQMYRDCKKEDIIDIISPVGMPGRAINNDFVARVQRGEVHDGCSVSCLQRCDLRDKKIGYCIIGALSRTRAGKVNDGIIFCGSNAYRSAEQGIVPVARIIKELTGGQRI